MNYPLIFLAVGFVCVLVSGIVPMELVPGFAPWLMGLRVAGVVFFVASAIAYAFKGDGGL